MLEQGAKIAEAELKVDENEEGNTKVTTSESTLFDNKSGKVPVSANAKVDSPIGGFEVKGEGDLNVVEPGLENEKGAIVGSAPGGVFVGERDSNGNNTSKTGQDFSFGIGMVIKADVYYVEENRPRPNYSVRGRVRQQELERRKKLKNK